MKKLLCALLFAVLMLCTLVSCDEAEPAPDEDVITVEGGYLVVNGVKTKYEVKKEDVIKVENGYLIVNGVKTEYKVEIDCDHIWQTVTIPHTCTEDGYDVMTCSFCNESVRTNVVKAPYHKYPSDYTFDNEYHWFVCTVCDEPINKTLHTPDDNSCTVCNAPFSPSSGIIYDVSADGTYAEVLDYTGAATKIKIASEYNGLPVKNIYSKAFERKKITSVIIPDSVTSIGYRAFYYCTDLKSVTILGGITNWGTETFYWCSSLESVIISEGTTTIGSYAFQFCSSLESVTIPNSVTSIGSYAFQFCSKLESVTIPNSVTSISSYAFQHCTNLKSITIPESVTHIGSDAFDNCNSALYTEYEYGKYIRNGNNPYAILIKISNKNMSTYAIHEDTKHIAQSVFSSCGRLNSITIPEGVTSIDNSAFSDCDNLTSITIPSGVTSIGSYAFSDCDNLTSITIPSSVTSIRSNTFRFCSKLESVTIPNSVTLIGSSVFYDCDNLKNIYYTGSEKQWNAILIEDNNYSLNYATIHYNYVP